jgi:hypothetical protein
MESAYGFRDGHRCGIDVVPRCPCTCRHTKSPADLSEVGVCGGVVCVRWPTSEMPGQSEQSPHRSLDDTLFDANHCKGCMLAHMTAQSRSGLSGDMLCQRLGTQVDGEVWAQ